MQALASIQSTVFLVIIVAIFVFTVVGLVSSLLYSDEMYRAADKRTKKFWCLILGASALVGFLAVPPLSAMPMFVTIIALIAVAVYWVDVRPALRSVDPRRRNKR
ncbi:DUF2516 family protein [Brevibacterium yomogidense]|uniref:DUF2516 family protein n=1 Tax=Brevibacterium yomogidense TaxID=946573 RepID=A0A1X6XN82_9MICO|nr:DUF2516 family protein [Brevibacterium yomogidense]SLN00603.1 hypothetical protein FM105_13070 [Brevibacterium yomogidense]